LAFLLRRHRRRGGELCWTGRLFHR
jgi:hypothetical protein